MSANAKKVLVLMGGWSAEREVSLSSGADVLKALRQAGYNASAVDVTPQIAEVLVKEKPDVVFNALHGRWGEDGCIQGLLELLGIPYTHSGVMASAIAMDKPMAKKIFAEAGLPLAEGKVIPRAEILAQDPMARPYVVKPINEGSSVGVKLVFEGENMPLQLPEHPEFLVEKFIPGREIQVAVMGDEISGVRALGAIEICPKGKFYDYEAKYTEGKALHKMPAPIDPIAYKEALRIAEHAHLALGCRGVTRADLRYDDTNGEPGEFYLLEVNTQPGMTPLSLAPEIAAHQGISYVELVSMLVEQARCGA